MPLRCSNHLMPFQELFLQGLTLAASLQIKHIKHICHKIGGPSEYNVLRTSNRKFAGFACWRVKTYLKFS